MHFEGICGLKQELNCFFNQSAYSIIITVHHTVAHSPLDDEGVKISHTH